MTAGVAPEKFWEHYTGETVLGGG